MISREELETQVEAMQITLANVERDYVFGWLISGFYAESQMAGALTLKGGNALRKGYLPASRFSDDLDFSCATDLDETASWRPSTRVAVMPPTAAG